MPYAITTECTGCRACKTICPSNAVSGKRKERHIIDPENCIGCGACGRVCPVSAVEDDFGMIVLRVKKKDWPRPVIDLETCMSCGICEDTCPSGALDMALQKTRNPHPFPLLPDESACMGCGFCAKDCPVSAIIMEKRQNQPKRKANGKDGKRVWNGQPAENH